MNFLPIKISIVKLTLIFILVIQLLVIFNIKPWKNANQKNALINWDVTSYYSYLPALFIHQDLKFNFLEKSKIGILSTEATLKTKVYNRYFDKSFKLVSPISNLQKLSVNKSIKFVKMGKIKEAEKAIRPAVNYLMKIKCKKIILGCTELPIAIFAYKSFKKIKQSKVFVDPNLLVANVSMKKYKKLKKQYPSVSIY